jgi:hypothetical protein
MDGDENRTFWRVLRPSAWPQAPSWMSYSMLSDLEACPRRWALCAAEYPEVWGRRGYPRPPQAAALEGTVVHLSLQKLTGALLESGCPSLSHESAVSTLRRIGGFTAIVLIGLKQALEAYRGNPRAVPILDGIRRRLTARVPELRSRVQRFLARIHLEGHAGSSANTVDHWQNGSRRPLSHGSYAEVDLRSSEMRWRGIADLLTLSGTRCEIRDFKTGVSKKEHELQLRTYALLWARDRDVNPTGRLVDRVVISYDEGDMEVPAPNGGDLRHLEGELRTRTAKAVSDLGEVPPEARPSQENCPYCPVRHLCDEYWPWYAREGSSDDSARTAFGDVQIRLTDQHGPSSWDGVVEAGPRLKGGAAILLRTGSGLHYLHPGQRARLLNVHISVPDAEPVGEQRPDPAVVASMGGSSEVFLLTT